jgi:hypothetical protein
MGAVGEGAGAVPPLEIVTLTVAPGATGSPADGLVATTRPAADRGAGMPEMTPTARPA